MRSTLRAAAAALLSVAAGTALPAVPAFAKVKVAVDLDAQTMHVDAKDKSFDWKVSSGGEGFETPTGTYGVLWSDKDHKSDEYDGAPMPNAIFFKPGFAIHGAYKSNWGHPASHGCVRLPVAKSAILWDLVKNEGGAEITITGTTPATRLADRPQPSAGAPVGAPVAATASARMPVDDYDSYEVPGRAYRGQGYGSGYGTDDRGLPPPSYGRPGPADGLFGSVY